MHDDSNNPKSNDGSRYLTFTLNNQSYGVEIQSVTEIIGIQPLTEIPDVPPYIRGVINLRGKVIPVMDVRMRMRMPSREADSRTCIIVVRNDHNIVGLLVDRVAEVLVLNSDQIEKHQHAGGSQGGKYISGMGKIGDQVTILIELTNLLLE